MEDNQDALELKRRARRRLVGAIALVVLAVIVLPIVFDHEPKAITQDLIIQIPSQDAGKFSSRVTVPVFEPVPAPSRPASEVIPPAATAAVPMNASQPPEASKPLPVEPKVAPAKESVIAGSDRPVNAEASRTSNSGSGSESKSSPKPAKETAKTAQNQSQAGDAEPAQPGSFFVPLGSFSKQENVRVIQGRVSAAGFKIFSEKSAESGQTRIRAGPFPTREAAEKAREKLKSAGIDVGPVGSR